MARFDGKHIVITGGTGVLGRAVVGAFINEGAICHIPSIDGDPFHHDKANVVHDVDLGDEALVKAFFTGLPQVDAVVNIAGGFLFAPLADTSLADLQHQLSMNLVSCFASCREGAARMARNGGAIVNITARAALTPRSGANMSAYTAAKAGVAALSQALAEELKGQHIRVNAIAPSIIDTPTNRQDMPDADVDAWVKPEALANLILSLCSDDCAVTSGSILEAYAGA